MLRSCIPNKKEKKFIIKLAPRVPRPQVSSISPRLRAGKWTPKPLHTLAVHNSTHTLAARTWLAWYSAKHTLELHKASHTHWDNQSVDIPFHTQGSGQKATGLADSVLCTWESARCKSMAPCSALGNAALGKRAHSELGRLGRRRPSGIRAWRRMQMHTRR